MKMLKVVSDASLAALLGFAVLLASPAGAQTQPQGAPAQTAAWEDDSSLSIPLDELIQETRYIKVRLLHVELQRAQVLLMAWRAHNENTEPDADQLNEWPQFIEDAGVEDDQRLIRIAAARPRNFLNDRTDIAVVDRRLSPGDSVEEKNIGFVYSTRDRQFWPTNEAGDKIINHDLRAVFPDAFDVPDIANMPLSIRNARARVGAVQVQAIRAAIDLYQLQHGGQSPDFVKFRAWQQLTCKTDETGAITSRGRFGPYLSDAPINLVNGSSRISTVETVSGYPFTPPMTKSGYVFATGTSEMFSTNSLWTVSGWPTIEPKTISAFNGAQVWGR